ncbi:MFS transporter [Novosphingobium colocasiae]
MVRFLHLRNAGQLRGQGVFFPNVGPTLQLLLVWAGFAVGFGFRPLGAILFGYWGDKLGRKYTFLVTVTLMGISTAGVGFIPSAETIGLWAPFTVLILRILQGLALGGEYGGAAIYVSEHSPPSRRGYYTGYIQSSVVGGFVLSLIVVLTNAAIFPGRYPVRLGLARAVRAEPGPAGDLAVDAAQAIGKPGVSGDARTGRNRR